MSEFVDIGRAKTYEQEGGYAGLRIRVWIAGVRSTEQSAFVKISCENFPEAFEPVFTERTSKYASSSLRRYVILQPEPGEAPESGNRKNPERSGRCVL